jgi:hypothetical protein
MACFTHVASADGWPRLASDEGQADQVRVTLILLRTESFGWSTLSQFHGNISFGRADIVALPIPFLPYRFHRGLNSTRFGLT